MCILCVRAFVYIRIYISVDIFSMQVCICVTSVHVYTYVCILHASMDACALMCVLQAGINDKISHEMAEKILIEMGEFFQIQVIKVFFMVSTRMSVKCLHIII